MELKNTIEDAKNNLQKFENVTVRSKNNPYVRPETPCINFYDGKNNELASNDLNNYFSLFMKKIVDTINWSSLAFGVTGFCASSPFNN